MLVKTKGFVTIIVAVIGLVGVVGVAVYTNYQQNKRFKAELLPDHHDITVLNQLENKIRYVLKSIDIKTGQSVKELDVIISPGDTKDVPNFVEDKILEENKLITGIATTTDGQEVICDTLSLSSNILYTITQFNDTLICEFSGG